MKLPRLPHEVWASYGVLFTPEEAYDFDMAVLDFDDWFEARAREQVIGQDKGLKPRRGQAIVQKYPTVKSILDLITPDSASTSTIRPPDLSGVGESKEDIERNLADVMDAFTDTFGDDFP